MQSFIASFLPIVPQAAVISCWQSFLILCQEADGLFDIAAVLGQDAPNEHLCIYGGHPEARGCAAVAEAYLRQM